MIVFVEEHLNECSFRMRAFRVTCKNYYIVFVAAYSRGFVATGGHVINRVHSGLTIIIPYQSNSVDSARNKDMLVVRKSLDRMLIFCHLS